jgi:hypothetical protein
MLRAGLIAGGCLILGFAAGLVAAPKLRAPASDSPPIATERAGGAITAAQTARATVKTVRAPVGQFVPAAPVPRLAVSGPGARQAAPAPAHAHEPEKVRMTVDQLPPALRAVVTQVAQGREIRNLTLEREIQDGMPAFETEFEIDGMEHELKMDENGKILATEVDFALNEFPAVVTAAIQNVMPGAVLLKGEREQILDRAPFFEIQVQHDGKRYELQINEDGRVLNTSPR